MGALNGKKLFIISAAFLLLGLLLTQGGVFEGRNPISEKPVADLELASSQESDLVAKDPLSARSDGKISLEERLRILLVALDQGSSPGLEILDEELLKRAPDYETKILPYLKIQALRSVIGRITSTEWAAGRIESRVTLQRDSKSASEYLAKLALVHPTLALFLEVAIPEFFDLSLAIAQGKAVPNTARSFSDVSTAKRAVGTGNSAKGLFTADASFQVVFEEQRCDLTLNYFKNNPNRLWEQYQLLQAVDPRFCKKELSPIALGFILRVIKDASPKLRADIINQEMEFKIISKASQNNHQVSNALSDLLAVGAIDALRGNDPFQADALLDYSEQLAPGRGSQRKVRAMLGDQVISPRDEAGSNADEELLQELLSGKREQEKTSSRRSLFPDEVKERASPASTEEMTGSLFGLIVPLIIFLLAGGATVLFLLRLRRRFAIENELPGATRITAPPLVKSQSLSEPELWGEKPDPALTDVTKNRTINE